MIGSEFYPIGTELYPIGGATPEGVECWHVTENGGFADIPAGSLLYYVPDGIADQEGLYIIQENKPNGKLFARHLSLGMFKIRLNKRKLGKVYGAEITIEVKDPNPKYVCLGRVRLKFVPC